MIESRHAARASRRGRDRSSAASRMRARVAHGAGDPFVDDEQRAMGGVGGGTVIHARGLSRGYSPLVLGPPFLLDNGAMRERESRLAYEQRFSARQRIRPCDLISVARL